MKCNYRVYGTIAKGYELIKTTPKEAKAMSYLENKNYTKVLIIRHDFEHDCDEPIALAYPRQEKVLEKKKIRGDVD